MLASSSGVNLKGTSCKIGSVFLKLSPDLPGLCSQTLRQERGERESSTGLRTRMMYQGWTIYVQTTTAHLPSVLDITKSLTSQACSLI